MNDIELLKSTVSEYRGLAIAIKKEAGEEMDTERIVSILSRNHDWTDKGACEIARLASEYGSFMLRNALAVAIVLGLEDGNLGF